MRKLVILVKNYFLGKFDKSFFGKLSFNSKKAEIAMIKIIKKLNEKSIVNKNIIIKCLKIGDKKLHHL